MSNPDVQQARAWLETHKPRTIEAFDAMDDEARRLYKQHMDIIKAHVDAWLQEHDPQGYAALLAEARQGLIALEDCFSEYIPNMTAWPDSQP